MLRAFLSVGVWNLLSAVAIIQAAEPEKASAKDSLTNELIVGEPLRHGNLTIFPVMSRTPRTADRFLTLDEGLKAGTVEVLEAGAVPAVARAQGNAERPARTSSPQRPTRAARQSAQRSNRRSNSTTQSNAPTEPDEESNARHQQAFGNDVNRLFVVNKSDKPLYLMPGEIIIGGDQDRAIGQEYVIQPTNKPEPISVFCVEHGRWGMRDHQELADLVTEATAQQDRRSSVAMSSRDAKRLAKQADEGKFIGSVGKLSKGARIAVQEGKGQSAVWDEVGKENGKSSVKSKSGAFTGNYAEKGAVERLDPYISKLQSPVAKTRQVVGVIVAVNDKMDSAEILESTPLFNKLWPKLLKSYAPDAANAAGGENAKKTCTREEALGFLTELQTAKPDARDEQGVVGIARHVSSRLSTSTAFDRTVAPSAGGGMGGFGGGIHSSGFSK